MRDRKDIEEKYKWDLTDVFNSDKEFHNTIKEVQEKMEAFHSFKGKLGTAGELKKCFELYEDLSKKIGLLWLYSFVKSDEDTRIGENQALKGQFFKLNSAFEAVTSFIEPELLTIGDELQNLAKEESLAIYAHYFDDLLRQKAHKLSDSEEAILAKLGEIAPASSNIYSMINNADISFEDVKDKDGNLHKLTHSSARFFAESDDRELRKNASTNTMKEYASKKNTITQTFIENLKKDRVMAHIRNYNSPIEMKLFQNNIPLAVYNNLLETVAANIKPLHKFSEIRQKVLGLDTLYNYDNFVSLVKGADNKISYEEAVSTVLKSLKILGEEYFEMAKTAFESRWIDVYENTGKSSGAYSAGVPGVHPYILMNFNDTIGDMFTLTHEMGHAMHSYFTDKTQPKIYSDYTIFLAEIASTVNEALLYEYLIENTTDPKKRAYLLNERIDSFRNTLFRQVTFAAFEKEVHELAKEGSLTTEKLNEVFLDLSKKELGSNVEFISGAEFGWARIPHFYRSFYVYQYATGFCASVAIVEKIKKEGAPAINAYLNMLKAGNSGYSVDLLKAAGVDLTTKEPIEAALKNFAQLVDQFEAEILKIQ
ncbi:MAG: oligoendopeptidase F [Defluviitaleaceae bacterium]|nr:oligoendopeptidase F [Defluviitaleaceae bacterium]